MHLRAYLSIYYILKILRRSFFLQRFNDRFRLSNFDRIILLSHLWMLQKPFQAENGNLFEKVFDEIPGYLIPSRHIPWNYKMNFDGILIIFLIKSQIRFQRLVVIKSKGRAENFHFPRLQIWPNYCKLFPPFYFHDYFYWSLIITETNTWCVLPPHHEENVNKTALNQHHFTQRYAFINLEDASVKVEGIDRENSYWRFNKNSIYFLIKF